ncbi:MAG: MerR family transcriptional regulator [Cyanobacteria bacterium J06638_7]
MESQVPRAHVVPPGTDAGPPALEKIGAVALHSGVPVKTIRFYCDEGLMRPRARSEGNYRLFDAGVYDELKLIRMLRALEIPLPTIGAVLEARRSGVCQCDQLKATIGGKAAEIERRICDLQHLHRELAQMLEGWRSCGGRRQDAAPEDQKQKGRNWVRQAA